MRRRDSARLPQALRRRFYDADIAYALGGISTFYRSLITASLPDGRLHTRRQAILRQRHFARRRAYFGH